VTANGQILRASEQDNPDLFWALRGGGNFGVVTEFEFRLHDVGPIIDFAMLFYPLEQGAEALWNVPDFIDTG
jgi:FAD/FMN-containing dehydrogenase